MIRPECEQHHTPARDNQYRATARYYKDSCPYCEIDRLKEYEDAVTSAVKGEVLVYNLMETNCTVIKNDYWRAHLEEIDRLNQALMDIAGTADEEQPPEELWIDCIRTAGAALRRG